MIMSNEKMLDLVESMIMANHYTSLMDAITKGKQTSKQKKIFIPEKYWDDIYIAYCEDSISDLIEDYCKAINFESLFPEIYGENVDWDALEEKYGDVDFEYETLKSFMLSHENDFIVFVEKENDCDEHTKPFVLKILHKYFKD